MLGEGVGGAALALLPADRTVAARHSWITPLPPEGASAIVHGTPDHAAKVSERQHIRAFDLLRHGVVDVIVDDDPDGGGHGQFLHRLTLAVELQLQVACSAAPELRRTARRSRWRGGSAARTLAADPGT